MFYSLAKELNNSVWGKKSSKALDLSIVICTKDRVRLAIRALKSIAALRLLPAEVLLIDSTKNQSLNIQLKKVQWPFKISYFRIEDEGLGQSRNFALSVVRTKYFAFMDDDEIVPPTYTKVIKEELIGARREVLVGWARVLYPQNYWHQVWDSIWTSPEDEVGTIDLIPTACSAFVTKLVQDNPIYFDSRLKDAAEEEFFTHQVLKYAQSQKIYSSARFFVFHEFRTDLLGFSRQFFTYGYAQAQRYFLENTNPDLFSLYHFYFGFNYRMASKSSFRLSLWPGLIVKNLALWSGFISGLSKQIFGANIV